VSALPAPESVLAAARAAKGFMPDEEGLALAKVAGLVGRLPQHEADSLPGNAPPRPAGRMVIMEVGAYCGRSTLYLVHGVLAGRVSCPSGGTDERFATIVFSLDHHHGSEENQAGWEHHDSSLVDPATGRLDTLPAWRRAIEGAGVEELVVGLVGDSATIAARWAGPCGMVFIDGGHGAEPAWADYRGWSPHIPPGGFLAIHDVFPDPADGGRPPYDIYLAALDSGGFCEEPELGCGSLRVLRRLP
jgi:MMP 1-O-methyltransferase